MGPTCYTCGSQVKSTMSLWRIIRVCVQCGTLYFVAQVISKYAPIIPGECITTWKSATPLQKKGALKIVHVDTLHNVRKHYGECCQEKHYRYKVQPPDPVHGLNGRNLYNEWQEFMWRRKKREYWSTYDEKKLKKLRHGLEVLTKKKEQAANMVEYYGGLKKKRMSQQKKNKK